MANCPHCYGTGVVHRLERTIEQARTLTESAGLLYREPCPECHGYGIVHCCDGLIAEARKRSDA